MPLGNLTSQFFANVYLNELDYFVKHELKAKYYIRYVDDFIILHNNKEILQEWKNRIKEFLGIIKLELHEKKSKVYPLYKGANLLGFRVFYHYKLPRKSNARYFMRRLNKFTEVLHKNKVVADDIMKSVAGWLAYAEHGNTYKLRNRIRKILRNHNISTA